MDFLDPDFVIARLSEAAQAHSFCQLATVNLDFLVQSHRDREVRTILAQTDLNIPDGAPVIWAGRLMGLTGLRRVTGSDLVPLLAAVAATQGLRLFFLGGVHGSAARAADRLRAKHPALEIDTFEPPHTPLASMNNDEILARIRSATPHILLVAFGHPKQEQWIYRNKKALPMVCMGVGCCFELLAGDRTRAPKWVQHAGLEWLYRLVHEPRRLVGRYATDAVWLVRDLLPWAFAQRFLRSY